jgi:hypothetical protein
MGCRAFKGSLDRGSQGEKKVANFGTREHQKVLHSILYSSPSHFPKFIRLSGILVKKLLNLLVQKYCALY